MSTLDQRESSNGHVEKREPLFDEIEDKSYLEIYLDLKREQQFIERKLETVKGLAFGEAAEALRGETRGYLHGAHVEIRYRSSWQYSGECEAKKSELDALKKYEERTGKAVLLEQTGYLSVSFKKRE